MRFLVIGAGQMGRGLVYDLLNSGHEVVVLDQNARAVAAMREFCSTSPQRESLLLYKEDTSQGWSSSHGVFDCVISAVPYDFNPALTEQAIDKRSHFVDLGGNNDVVESQFQMTTAASKNGVCVVPDCGLAPGLVSLLAVNLIEEAVANKIKRKEISIRMYVGGLPLRRNNPLQYEIVFSPHGLINEFVEPAVILEDGKVKTVPSMTEVEGLEFPFAGLHSDAFGLAPLEAFYTSGGISTMAQSYEGKIADMSYKTIRYQGHCDQMNLLLDLFVRDKPPEMRERFETLLAQSIPLTGEDVILLRVESFAVDQPLAAIEIVDYPKDGLSAMARMTAFPASIVAQMISANPSAGVWTQEDLFKTRSIMVIDELIKRGVDVRRTYY